MADLITVARAKQAIIGQSTFNATENATITTLVTDVSQTIQNICREPFTSTTYIDIHNGSGTRYLQLTHYPIISITRFATDISPVLLITNTSALNQRATVRTTATGISL